MTQREPLNRQSSVRLTICGTPLEPGETFAPEPSADPDCRMCNWPYDDGSYCRRCSAVIRQEDTDV